MPETATTTPDTAAAPAPRSALIIVFLVVFIDLLGFGIVLPLLARFADTYLAVLVPGKDAAVTGPILGALMASFSAMQFIFAPLWGRVSDRIGRRPVLLVGLAGSVVFYGLLGYASDLPPGEYALLAMVLLFVARIGAGVAGATISTAQAVIADCTTPEKRKHGMAMIGAAFGIGFTVGPLLGALALWLVPEHRGVTGLAAAVLSLIAFLLGLQILPETRKFGTEPTARRKWLDTDAWRKALASRAIAPVVLVFFMASVGFSSFEVTLALLTRDALNLGDGGNVWIFAYVGFVLLLAQGGLYHPLAKRLSEPSLMGLGIVFMGLGVLSLGAVNLAANAGTFDVSAWAFFTPKPTPLELLGASAGASSTLDVDLSPPYLLTTAMVALACSVIGFALLTPSAQALISRRADANQQGEILGVNQSGSALARILGPVVGLTLYKVTGTHLLPYLFGGVLLLLMLPLLPRIRRG